MDSSENAQVASPFGFLINPTTTEFAADLDQAPRKRGRPRKYFTEVVGKQKHRMDDKAPTAGKDIPHLQRLALVEDYKRIKRQGSHTVRGAIEFLAKQYKITYVQAHQHLESVI